MIYLVFARVWLDLAVTRRRLLQQWWLNGGDYGGFGRDWFLVVVADLFFLFFLGF